MECVERGRSGLASCEANAADSCIIGGENWGVYFSRPISVMLYFLTFLFPFLFVPIGSLRFFSQAQRLQDNVRQLHFATLPIAERRIICLPFLWLLCRPHLIVLNFISKCTVFSWGASNPTGPVVCGGSPSNPFRTGFHFLY